jgi:integrase
MGVIKEFLLANDVDMSASQTRKITRSIKKGGAQTIEDELTRDVIHQILTHSDLMMRALIIMMVSSGMRIGEAVRVRMSDIDLDADVGVIRVRTTKSGNPRVTFCNNEAVILIREWITIRPRYMNYLKTRYYWHHKNAKIEGDDRLFPCGVPTAEAKMKRLLVRAGRWKLDPVTKKATIRFHMMRKYFYTQMNPKISEKALNVLVGHRTELDSIYNKITQDELKKIYIQGEPALRIFDASADDILKMHTELDELHTGYDEMKRETMDFRVANMSLKQEKTEMQMQVSILEAKQAQMERDMKNIQTLLNLKKIEMASS